MHQGVIAVFTSHKPRQTSQSGHKDFQRFNHPNFCKVDGVKSGVPCHSSCLTHNIIDQHTTGQDAVEYTDAV